MQLDEPCFVEDRSERELDALRLAYEGLAKVHERARIVVKTYFDHVGDAYGGPAATCRSRGSASTSIGGRRQRRADGPKASGGLEDSGCSPGSSTAETSGSTDLEHSLDLLAALGDRSRAAGRLDVAARSCTSRSTSTPSRRGDADLDAEMRSWMAFAARRSARWRPWPGPGRGPRGDRRASSTRNDRALEDRAQLASDPQRRRARAGRRLDEPTRAATSPYEDRGQAQRAAARAAAASRPPRSARIPQTAEIREARAAAPRGRDRRRPSTTGGCRREIERVIGSRRTSASTCWSTASPSATTWSSTSPSRCTATSSPRTPGCSPTARATCARRSSSATSPAARR